jgi:hypothetical protein
MASLTLATCDPAATPAVSAAKALVVEEHIGLLAASGNSGSGGRGSAGAAPSPGFASSSLAEFENSLPWNHRYNVPTKLHYVAPKPIAVASEAKRAQRQEKRAREAAALAAALAAREPPPFVPARAPPALKVPALALQLPRARPLADPSGGGGGAVSSGDDPGASPGGGNRGGAGTAPPLAPPPLSAAPGPPGSPGPEVRQGPPSWSGFSGPAGGGDGAGGGPSDEPWDYGELFAPDAGPPDDP